MEQKRGSVVWWVVCGILAVLLCCLCALVVIGGGATLAAWLARPYQGPPLVATLFATPGPSPTPQTMPTEPAAIPPQADDTAWLLSSVEVPLADPISLAERLAGVVNPARVVAQKADPIPLGTVETFWASDTDNNTNFQVDATLVYASDHVYFWVEKGVDHRLTEVKHLVDQFEKKTYGTDRAFFGSEWTPGVDGDVHLYVLYARGLGNSVGGYFSSNDEFPPQVHKYSNAHEMFYLNADNLPLGSSYADSTMAHEFQHMIEWNVHRNEDSWMNEGFSVLAELLNGYDVGGADYVYAADTDITLTEWPSPPDTRHYGQAFLFLTYFLDRFGEQATKALVADQAKGLDSIDHTLARLGEKDPQTGKVINADDVFRDWAVAMELQDPSVGDGRDVVRSDPSAPRARPSEEIGNCPVVGETRSVAQYGIDAIDIRCKGNYILTFDGTTLAKVVPADPHSGDYAFWSNRGDESDMTLTRAFDLSKASGTITADYWVWYDIEKDYDYVYFEASDDGGKTWRILKTPSGTDTNPSGNSYGRGYTGDSGGEQPHWIEESVDLSQYAGKQVLLRCEYVTDAAVNGEGLLLDDFAIPAIGYEATFDDGADGWQADGFVRLYNRIPQTYRVVLVEKGGATTVQDVSLDSNQHAQLQLDLSGKQNGAILIVVGTARHTWQPAPYRIQIIR